MRLGDLDDLKEHISQLILVYSGTELDNAILNAIDNAPTVPLPDFKEGYRQAIIDGKANYSRPQGEWISNNYGEHHCSLCHHEADYNEYDYEYYEHLSDYCPNCGAKMMKGGVG
jgi:hypothetical protein